MSPSSRITNGARPRARNGVAVQFLEVVLLYHLPIAVELRSPARPAVFVAHCARRNPETAVEKAVAEMAASARAATEMVVAEAAAAETAP